MSKEVIEKFSKVREDSSIIYNTMVKMRKTQDSRGLALAITSLEKGRMYLGEVMLALGSQFPYEKTKQATKPEEIQKAIETSDKELKLDDNEIINLNNLREVLEKKLKEVMEVFFPYAEERTMQSLEQKFIEDVSFAEGYRCYKEARMWLGIRLGEIRDNG